MANLQELPCVKSPIGNSSLFVFTYGLYNNIITYRQHIVNTPNYPMVDVKVKSTERVARCDGVGICCMIALLIRALPRDLTSTSSVG